MKTKIFADFQICISAPLNNGFYLWNLNQTGSTTMILLTWNSLTMITFTSNGKAMNYWQKKLLIFLIIRNTRWLIQNLHIGTLLLFHIILQIFHLFLLKALFPSLFNHSRFLLGKTSAQNSCFSPSAHKSSVTSALVKNVSSLSSNSANSLIFYQFLLNLLFLCLFLIFVSLPHFQILMMLCFKNSLILTSSFTNSASQLSFCRSKFSNPKIPTTPKSSISLSLANHNNFFLQFLTSLNLMIQILLVHLLKHLIFCPFQ